MTRRYGISAAIGVLFVSACAAIGSSGEGDRDLPTAGVGPFRKLDGDELLGVAPYVLDDRASRYRSPSVVPAEPGADGTRVILFTVATESADAGGHDVIVRTRADDARSFFGSGSDPGHAPRVVLRADAAWEGDSVGEPSAVWIGSELYVYYAAAGGIGLARASDGVSFRKESAPVVSIDTTSAWENGAPHAPSVAVMPDGKIRMLYAAGSSIGEAESADGVTWHRVGNAPVLRPSAKVDPATLLVGEKPPFDTARVTDPCLAPRITPAGRLHVRVLYTGFDETGASTIGFAARYGDDGPLSRQSLPIYSVGKHEAAPALFEWSGGSLLYVEQDHPTDLAMSAYSAIAAAFSPANLRLPAATAYADGP